MVANLSEWWRWFKQNWIILIIWCTKIPIKVYCSRHWRAFQCLILQKRSGLLQGDKTWHRCDHETSCYEKEIEQINSEHFKAELNWICLIGISVFLVVSDDLNWCRFSLKNYLTITKNMIPWNWHAFYRTKYSDEKCFFSGSTCPPRILSWSEEQAEKLTWLWWQTVMLPS